MKIVIRAGGTGTRLWPLSRRENPKQFQKIGSDKSMIRTTYERIAPLLNQKNELFISVNERFKKRLIEEIPEVSESNIISETDARNTGPAVCLEICFLNRFLRKEEVIASLPSDDFISDPEAFKALLLNAQEFIARNPEYLITPAIKPDYPDTGYSYLKIGRNLRKEGEEGIYEVADMVEKPELEFCEELVKTGVYYCHTGMYLWQLGNISSLFKKYQPEMHKICSEIVDLLLKKQDSTKVRSLYGQIEKTTIEAAITNKAKRVAMSVSNRIGWSDLGKWHIIKRVLGKSGEVMIEGRAIVNECTNNLVFSKNKNKLIIVNEVDNIAIIDTEDALYVSSLDKSADIKEIIEKNKEELKNFL